MRRVFALALRKISVLFGGRPILLPASLAALALCFITVGSVINADRSQDARISIVDSSNTELSRKLVSEIVNTPGLSAVSSDDMRSAEDDIAEYRSEAILVIKEGYEEHIADESISSLITLLMAPGSVSADLIRETVSGKLLAQRAQIRAVKQLESEGMDTDLFYEYCGEYESPSIYKVTSAGGGKSVSHAVFGQSFPGYAGFAALALMLIVLSLTRQLSAASSKLVGMRLRVPLKGRLIGFLSDSAAVFITAFAFAAVAFALCPNRTASFAAGLLCYCLLLTGLCILLSKIVGAGRIDVASPFIALVTSILGGCFVNLGKTAGILSTIAKFTPQGQLIAASSGSYAFAALLAAEGILLLAVSYLIGRRASA